MYELKSDTNHLLSEFLNDYVEGILAPPEHAAFKECLAVDYQLASLTDKSKAGKRMLANAYRVKAADNFEEKLKRRIDREKKLIKRSASVSS